MTVMNDEVNDCVYEKGRHFVTLPGVLGERSQSRHSSLRPPGVGHGVRAFNGLSTSDH
jgi:hypothetical protein